MRILHCLNQFLPGQTAGTEVYTWALCKGLQMQNIVSEVAIPNYGESQSDNYYYDGIKVHRFAEPSKVDRDLQMGFRIPDGVHSFRSLLNDLQPDIVQFHELAGSNGFTLHHVAAAKDAGFKVVMTFHLARYSCKTGTLMYKNESHCDGIIDVNKCTICCYHVNGLGDIPSSLIFPVAKLLQFVKTDASKWDNPIGTLLGYPVIIKKLKSNLDLLNEYCDKMVLISKWYYDILRKNGIKENKMLLIKQGIFRAPIPLTNQPTKLPLRIIFVGRISHFKGVDILIEAMKQCDAEKIQLNIYGSGGEEGYMNSCKKASADMENIFWKGHLPPEEVIRTMNSHDLLCLPSTFSEMSPLVIQEAFAAGIPVLASDVYGNAEQITDGLQGWLFKFKNAASLAAQLQKLISQPELIDMAKQHIPRLISFTEVSKQYSELYQELLINNMAAC